MNLAPCIAPDEADQVRYVHAIARRVSALPGEGLRKGTPLATIGSGRLFAVTSAVPAAEFGAEALASRFEDLEWVRELALAHHRVLAGLVGRGTFVPLRLCTLFRGPAGIEAMLARHRGPLERALDRVDGAVELGLKVQVRRSVLMDWAWQRGEALAPARAAAAGASAGRGFFVRKGAEAETEAVARGFFETWTAESHRRLAGHAREAVRLGPDGEAGDGAIGFGAAYLVEHRASAGFRQALRELQASHAPQGLAFELSGPWPPYSFADVTIEEPSDAAANPA